MDGGLEKRGCGSFGGVIPPKRSFSMSRGIYGRVRTRLVFLRKEYYMSMGVCRNGVTVAFAVSFPQNVHLVWYVVFTDVYVPD